MREMARGILARRGYTEDFEEQPGHSYSGYNQYIARRPEGGWAKTGYDYGSCEYCDQTSHWTDDDYEAVMVAAFEGGLDEKPTAVSW